MAAATHPVSTPRPPTTAHELRTVGVACHKDPRTVAAAYEPGSRVESTTHAAVSDAAVRLGFAPPPPLPR